jgi:RNA polymerase sigma-70 factor, ECF subfamily
MLGQLPTRPPIPDAVNSVLRDDDACLVAAARTDPRAFAPLYARYSDSIYRYCARRVGDPEAAADATSQVFVKALAGLPGYRGDGPSFRSWLFAIAHNVLVDGDRTRRQTIGLEAAEMIASAAPSVEEAVLTAEVGRTIHGLLAQLTPDQREVMELRLAGLTGPEIAAAVNRSLGAVKISQVRAFARLRAAFGLTADPSKEVRRDGR